MTRSYDFNYKLSKYIQTVLSLRTFLKWIYCAIYIYFLCLTPIIYSFSLLFMFVLVCTTNPLPILLICSAACMAIDTHCCCITQHQRCVRFYPALQEPCSIYHHRCHITFSCTLNILFWLKWLNSTRALY